MIKLVWQRPLRFVDWSGLSGTMMSAIHIRGVYDRTRCGKKIPRRAGWAFGIPLLLDMVPLEWWTEMCLTCERTLSPAMLRWADYRRRVELEEPDD